MASRVGERLYRGVMARMTSKKAIGVNFPLGYMVGKDEQPPREIVLALAEKHCGDGVVETGVAELEADQWCGRL